MLTKNGDLDIKILDPEKKLIQRLETNQDVNYTFKAEETGNYLIVITGDNAGGSYEINWDVNS